MGFSRAAALLGVVAALAVLVSSVAAGQHNPQHGGVEDDQGRKVPGAVRPKGNTFTAHHFNLMFRTLLCVRRVCPPAPAAAADMPVDLAFHGDRGCRCAVLRTRQC